MNDINNIPVFSAPIPADFAIIIGSVLAMWNGQFEENETEATDFEKLMVSTFALMLLDFAKENLTIEQTTIIGLREIENFLKTN
jgi:hypothetical protein